MLSARWAPRFECFGKRYVVLAKLNGSAAERAVALKGLEAEALFKRATFPAETHDFPVAGSVLRRIAGELGLANPQEMRDVPENTLQKRLCGAIRAESLLVIEFERIPAPTPPASASIAGLAKPEVPWDAPPPVASSWIQLQVLGDEDKPLAGVRVRVIDAERGVREVTTNASGQLKLDQVPAGDCRVELPGLDGDAWELG
jgi:hypothetical protein